VGFFVQQNNGSTWLEASTGLPSTAISSLAVSGTNLFAGTFGSGVFLSTNNGASWVESSSGLATMSVLSLVIKGSSVFAGTGFGGVFRFD